jgi:class 3 adenylate cyclase
LERKVVLAEALDGLIEQCRRGRLPLSQALAAMLPRTAELVGADAILVRAYDEQLEKRAFRHGAFPAHLEAKVPEAFEGDVLLDPVVHDPAATLVLRRLDCADVVVGVAGFSFAAGLSGKELEAAKDVCRTASESLDNFLEEIASAAKKQRLSVSASAALRSSVLEEGADRAIALLSSALGLEEVALVFSHDDMLGGGRIHYRHYRQGDVVADSFDRPDPRLDEAVKRAGKRALDAQNHDIAAVLGEPRCVETALIYGVVDVSPVGKLIVRNAVGNLTPEGLDILNIFAECLSQRLVDYNRERRHLSEFFPHAVVTELCRDGQYHRKFLTPRVEPIAILFSDVSSFTGICEQVLVDAAKIGDLVDLWAGEAVRIIYEEGGVFDKLVGDCVIGHFGPPFYKSTPQERVAAAIRAAVKIARMTRRIGRERGYDPEIQARGIAPGLGTAAGVNYGPTSVGVFGPNQDFTGFSSHVNNAARLQGLAKWNEVLVMGPAREIAGAALDGDGYSFEGPEQAKVKNVKDPISYYKVKRPE